MEPEKSKGIAYLLLIAGPFFGLCGLHRLYMGQIGMGILYVLTYGLLGIGQLIDLFTFGRVIENHNLKRQVNAYGYGLQNPYNDNQKLNPHTSHQLMNLRKLHPEEKERALLELIRSKGGMITPIEVVSASSLNFEQAKQELDNFCIQGAAELRITEGGEIVYVFPGFLDDEQKRRARSVFSV
jgi:TM2 domain-containing membrane protein YozV